MKSLDYLAHEFVDALENYSSFREEFVDTFQPSDVMIAALNVLIKLAIQQYKVTEALYNAGYTADEAFDVVFSQ